MKPFYTRTRCVIGVLLVFLLPLVALAQPTNDQCANAIPVNSGITCTPVTATGSLQSATGGATQTVGIAAACGGLATSPDVWYVFTAQSATPTITLSNMGALMNVNRRIQVFNTTSCVVATLNLNALPCNTTATLTPTLVPGQQYLVRIFSAIASVAGTVAQWSFDMCIQDVAPANNGCAAVQLLTSSTTCNNTFGTLALATNTAGVSAFCGNAGSPDVWYSFVAQSAYPVITLSGMGSNIDDNPRLQLFNSAGCGAGVLNTNSLACVSGTNVTTLVLDVADEVGAAGLTIGNTYWVRVYTNSGAAPTNPSNSWSFNICVTDPVPPIPANDDCAGAIPLLVVASCGQFNLTGTVEGSTITAGVTAACTGPVSYDVWYKFVAVTANETITLGGAANNFTSRRMELFRGSCGGLISVAPCGTTSIVAAGLTVGNTYWIRVYSNSGLAAPATDGDFTICVTTTAATIPPRFGNSYVNITKKTTGGVVQNGDILEIRMTINYTGNATLFEARYVDNIPTNTAMLSTTADSIRIITNEGKSFRRYTPLINTNDDAATYRPGPLAAGLYNIKMNIGFSNVAGAPAVNNEADITGAVDIVSTDQPRGGNGVLFATAFRVRVTGTTGQIITLGTGKFIYRTTAGGADIALTTTPFQILISDPLTLCQNSIGLNNALESGGTFGTGSTLNRPTPLVTPIAGYSLVQQSTAQGIGDGQYGIVKNMSPRNGVNRNANRKNDCGAATAPFDCNNRMFNGFWDVDGDHTGTNNAAGNLPPAAGTDAGYMLVVNADYVASEVYTQNLTGLCPGTYYEFSAWMRNICAVCGLDASGTARYNPGVYPNMTFAMDGLDRYNTGEIDTVGWVKKGFVFLTGPAQTTASFSIRNNSQGGGGNDWAMDDIAVATCLPNMVYSPSANPTVCVQNAANISDTVRSFFNNYVYYKWQRSTDGGAIYNDLGPTQGPATPTFNAGLGLWEYVTNQFIPPSNATMANNGDMYRVIAATTPGNIGSTNCVVTNGVNFVTMNIMNCGTPLKTDLLAFNGKLNVDKATLSWTTSKEEEPLMYFIQRSTDGMNFKTVGSLNSHNTPANISNQYSFTDPKEVSGRVYYRLELANNTNNKKYSRIIDLSVLDANRFGVTSVVNPFNQVLDFSINSPADAKIDADLLDMFGKVVKRKTFILHSGVSLLSFTDVATLPAGTYVLRIVNNGQVYTTKIMKRLQ